MLQYSRFLVAWGLVWLSFTSRAGAGLFDLVYDHQPDGGVPPSYDIDGQHLRNVMLAAASMWDSIIDEELFGGDQIRIYYGWESMPSNSGQLYDSKLDEDTGRVREARIRFNQHRVFWIDPTPYDHSEFDMEQVHVRDAGGNIEIDFWYDESPPDLLEVGFAGKDKTETVANQGFPDATNRNLKLSDAQRDLLTLALHELGHALGIGPSSNARDDLLNDVSYDVDPDLAGGNGFEVLRNIQGESPGDRHLFPENIGIPPTLMIGANLGNTWLRRLPSATDVLVMASVDNWSAVDLPRQDFLGGATCWSCEASPGALAWVGNTLPDEDDHASLRHGGSVTTAFGADPHIANLTIESGSELHVAGGLSVSDTVALTDGEIEVGGGTVTAGRIQVGNAGLLLLDGGDLEAEELNIDFLGSLTGHGNLSLTGAGTNARLSTTGAISAQGGQTLAIETSYDTMNFFGEVYAVDGDLEFFALLGTDVSGLLEVGAARTVRFNDLRINQGATMFLNGGVGPPATLDPDQLGKVVVNSDLLVTGQGVVAGNAEFGEHAHVVLADGATLTITGNAGIDGGDATVPELSTMRIQGIASIRGGSLGIGDSASLVFDGPAEYAGGEITGDGLVLHNGNVLVSDDASITAHVFDMDGALESQDHFFTIESGANLTVNTSKLESALFADGYDGVFTLRGRASFYTDGAWRMDGVMRLENTGGGNPELIGSKVDINGTVELAGMAVVFSDVGFNQGSSLQTDSPDDLLQLRGNVTFAGGNYLGAGTVQQGPSASVIQDTIVSISTFDLDGRQEGSSTTILDGAALRLFSDHLDTKPAALDEFNGELNVAGTLHVANDPDEWTMAGVLNLDNGSITGAKMIVTGEVNGTGTIVTGLSNHGDIAPAEPQDPGPGLLEVVGDFTQTEQGRLTLRAYPGPPGAPSGVTDTLTVDGGLSLAGTLQVSFVDGFAPLAGDVFPLITTSGRLSGDFDSVTIQNLAPGFEFTTRATTTGSWQLIALNDGIFDFTLAGDYNDDGFVDALDYTVWRDNVGQPAGTLPNDGDGGVIGQDQYLTWRANYGDTLTSSAAGSSTVPEPSSIVLIGFVGLLAGRCKPRETTCAASHCTC